MNLSNSRLNEFRKTRSPRGCPEFLQDNYPELYEEALDLCHLFFWVYVQRCSMRSYEFIDDTIAICVIEKMENPWDVELRIWDVVSGIEVVNASIGIGDCFGENFVYIFRKGGWLEHFRKLFLDQLENERKIKEAKQDRANENAFKPLQEDTREIPDTTRTIARLKDAFHAAINKPKGVVPKEYDDLYEQDRYK